jgi:hypothetical protein
MSERGRSEREGLHCDEEEEQGAGEGGELGGSSSRSIFALGKDVKERYQRTLAEESGWNKGWNPICGVINSAV